MMDTYSTGTGSSSQSTFWGGADNPDVTPPIVAAGAKSEDCTCVVSEDRGVRRVIRNFTPS